MIFSSVSISTTVFIIAILLILLLIGFVIFLIARLYRLENKQSEIKKRYIEMENKIHELQLETLESKLNPHLFKNILNSIQSHAYQTYFALDKLAHILDYILYESKNKFVSTQQEVEFAISLIEINKIKISPLFDVTVKSKINENEGIYSQKLLAPLICIEIIENAFKHADIQQKDSFISIVFEFVDGVFKLTVANKISQKAPMRKEKSGIGLVTMEKRLKLIYDKNYSFETFIENDIHIAHLKINLLEHKAKLYNIG
jgi:LytS/YehU family sensor histidine kinase